jgi:hypothetical protein
MDPMKLITYVVMAAVSALLVIGGLGFYAGYSAGRRDISEVKAYIAAARLNLPVGTAGKDGAPSATISLEPGALEPVMTEIKALGETMADLQQRVASVADVGGKSRDEAKSRDETKSHDEARLREELTQAKQRLAEVTKEEEKLKAELVAVRQRAVETKDAAKGGGSQLTEELTTARALLAQSNSQASACQIQMTALENRLRESEAKPGGHGKGDLGGRSGGNAAGADSGSTLFYDSVTLKRAQSKVYNEVDVALSLEGVTARAARVAINKQGFSISFGERKVFQHNDATCELVLMESDLETNQARFNITCKR